MPIKVYRIFYGGRFDYVAAASYEEAVSYYLDELSHGLEHDDICDDVVRLDDETINKFSFRDKISKMVEHCEEFPFHLHASEC